MNGTPIHNSNRITDVITIGDMPYKIKEDQFSILRINHIPHSHLKQDSHHMAIDGIPMNISNRLWIDTTNL